MWSCGWNCGGSVRSRSCRSEVIEVRPRHIEGLQVVNGPVTAWEEGERWYGDVIRCPKMGTE